MKKYLIILLILTAMIGTGQSQITWPGISMQTKPWARWWWPGSAVKETDLSVLLEQYKEAELGGLEVTPIYGVKGQEKYFLNYLSPDWMRAFSFTLKKSSQLQLGIDMATGTGWPFGGPWVSSDDACKNFHMKVFTLKEGEQLTEKIEMIQESLISSTGTKKINPDSLKFPVVSNTDLQQYAFEQVRYKVPLPLQTLMAYSDNGEIKELTNYVDSSGILQWTVPKGVWNLYALFMGWHGKLVERAAPGGEGDVIDHFNSFALKNYLSKFDVAFKNSDIHYLRSFFNDSYEVDDARGQSNWTSDFFSEFQKHRGYDLKTQLPSLYSFQDGTIGSGVLYDYRLTIAELLYNNFTKTWQRWAKEKGKIIRSQAHGSPGNILDLYAAVDIPETEGIDILRFKFASSAAHVTGKKLVSAEAATWLDEHFCSRLSDVKAIADQFFIAGVNHLFYHGISYSPPAEEWPGWLFYASVHFSRSNPFWNDFAKLNEYVSRCQSFLQRGTSDNDILLYYPFSDFLSEKGSALLRHFDGMQGLDNSDFAFVAKKMDEKGYGFDYISDKQVMDLQVKGGKLTSGSSSYKTIVLPGCSFIPLATWQKLLQLAQEGATIIVYKQLPAEVPGFFNAGKQTAKLQQSVGSLDFNLKQKVSRALVGQGAFLLGDSIESLCSSADIDRENMTDNGIKYIRKKVNSNTEYFIVNNSGKEWNGWLPLHSQGIAVILFDPMTSRSGLARFEKDGTNYLKVFVQLKPNESCFIRILKEKIKGNNYSYILEEGIPEEIKGHWEVKFLNGGPSIPDNILMQQPTYWTDQMDNAYQIFSGTASYTIKFDNLFTNSRWYLLSLGKVSETARIYLNGEKIDVLIGPYYKLLVNAAKLKKYNNILEVYVSNSMINRVIDLDRRKVEWKKFYNINFPPFFEINKRKDGLFDASGWKIKESGLKGPVLLSPVILNE